MNDAAARAISDFLRALGLDPESDRQLQGTAERVSRLFSDELFAGLGRNPLSALDNAMQVEEGGAIVELCGIETLIVCPHHLTLGEGRATVAYRPSQKLVGFGALCELVEIHTRRPVLQEQACDAIARDLMEGLGAVGAFCELVIRHGCLSHHGPKQRNAWVRTLSLQGSFAPGRDDHTIAVNLVSAKAPNNEARGTAQR